MSEPIKAGDLAVVVKPAPCCGGDKALGLVMRVIKVEMSGSWCGICGGHVPPTLFAWDEPNAGVSVSRLKRIPPLSELEGEKRDEEITA